MGKGERGRGIEAREEGRRGKEGNGGMKGGGSQGRMEGRGGRRKNEVGSTYLLTKSSTPTRKRSHLT